MQPGDALQFLLRQTFQLLQFALQLVQFLFTIRHVTFLLADLLGLVIEQIHFAVEIQFALHHALFDFRKFLATLLAFLFKRLTRVECFPLRFHSRFTQQCLGFLP